MKNISDIAKETTTRELLQSGVIVSQVIHAEGTRLLNAKTTITEAGATLTSDRCTYFEGGHSREQIIELLLTEHRAILSDTAFGDTPPIRVECAMYERAKHMQPYPCRENGLADTSEANWSTMSHTRDEHQRIGIDINEYLMIDTDITQLETGD